VKRQIEIERKLVRKIVAFDSPHYFTPTRILPGLAERANALYHAYADYARSGNVMPSPQGSRSPSIISDPR
jgi:hypothetical protein